MDNLFTTAGDNEERNVVVTKIEVYLSTGSPLICLKATAINILVQYHGSFYNYD